ncbi:helix-turn-helix domain-containing protein [Xanthovirga aplysinae]|uniref:helix-turn-helix domain-containing protein n=1 Tax=Xanthovirga aplysinae TaxID=2529853 RepID=UPI0016569533|nr:helix-turn-helix domain-containing protein [Xanthovirga aplysinae]
MTKNIKKYAFKPGLPQEFEIVDIKELYKGFKHNLIEPHRTSFFHLIWFQNGSPTHTVDFNPIKIKPNTFLFLNNDVVQTFDDKGKFEGKAILFTDNFFCKTEDDVKFLKNSVLFNDLLSVSQIQLPTNSTVFAELFKQMENELTKPKDQYQSDILRNSLRNLLLLSERERRKQNFTEIKKGADLDYVIFFKDLLENQFKKQKQVKNYAQQMFITTKRLNKATSSVLGKSPKEIVGNRIILEAKRLLAYTNESIKEIGFHLGFEEPTNFIKYFRKHCNVTPFEFRENFSS